MSKFPLLSAYQIFATILAVIVVILGVIVAFGTANSGYDGFNLGAFIVTLLPFLGGAFGLGVAAELIQLFFQIEADLNDIREDLRQLKSSPNTAVPNSLSSQARPLPSTRTETQVTARIRVKAPSIAVREKPEAEAASASQLNSGQTMTVYGKNVEGTWLSISRVGKLWIETAGVDVIEGQVSLLTVMQPADK